jgi:NAD(P)-dependent dehydrogenase (short-subunit alcohol dehydrogenase family)
MGSLTGKVAVVTGGGSGIGLATAGLLAEAGASVAVVDLDGPSAERAAAGLGGFAVRADVGRPDEWTSVVDAVTSRFGGIDLAHLNAGVMTGEADIAALGDDGYRRIMGVNVDGVVFGIRALVPAMSARGGGAIVATASLAGLIGFSPDPIYTLTKHAVVGLVRALTPQLEAKGITCNAVCPGIVDTPLVGEARPMLEESGFPLIDARAVAATVVDLLSGEMSGEAVVIQAGRDPVPFRFGRPPGPRAGGTSVLPPEPLAAHDQDLATGRTRNGSDEERIGRGTDRTRNGSDEERIGRRTGQTTRPTPTKSLPVRTPVTQTDAPV